jgi:hypothetical protein
MSEGISFSQPYTHQQMIDRNATVARGQEVPLTPVSLQHEWRLRYYEVENLNWGELGTAMETQFGDNHWGRATNSVDLDGDGNTGVVVYVFGSDVR